MAFKPNGEMDSPSASSLFLPLRRRRGSIASVASQVDKETLTQALDNIHSAASQSDTLTTFNEYTSPPQSSAGVNDPRGIASDLQGGLSGLYSRFKATVGTPREQTSTDSEAVGDTPSKTPKPMSSTSILPPKSILAPGVQTTASPVPASPTFSRDTSIVDGMTESQHSSTSTAPKQNSRQDRSRAGTDASVISTAPAKTRKPLVGASRVSLGPSTQKIAEPTIAGITVNATKSTDTQGQAHTDFDGKVAQTPTSPFFLPAEKSKASLTQERSEGPDQAPPGFKSTSLLGRKTPLETPSDAISPSEHGDGPSYFPENAIVTVVEASSIHQSEDIARKVASKASREPVARLEQAGIRPVPERSPSQPLSASVINDLERTGTPVDSTERQNQPETKSSQAVSWNRTDPTKQSAVSYQIGSDDEALNTVGKLPEKGKPLPRTSSTGRGLNVVLSQIKSKVLSKEYWMRDENAKDCFYCGDPFSTFRRKHHCRTCGQIFDAKCTVLISGAPFGQAGTLRVCKPCEGIINAGDESSEYSDDGSVMGTGLRPRHGSSGTADLSPARSFTSLRTAFADNRGEGVPSMAIPAARKVKDDSKKRQDVLEIDFEPKSQLVRPGSSRSLKSAGALRSHQMGHRRHHSKSLLGRNVRPTMEDVAPFHTSSTDAHQSELRLPAFHSDNVIDPELADYMSDEESSADEQAGIMATINGETSRSVDTDGRSLVSNLFSQHRKNRSRREGKSISGFTLGGRDTDSLSMSSARIGNGRPSKRRNFSISSNIHPRSSPRGPKNSTLSPEDYLEDGSPSFQDHFGSPEGLKITRSSAMRGPDAPAIELSNASIQHVRKLLTQLLRDFKVPNTHSWEKALLPILLKATDDVTPDVQNGDSIDIRHYVKLKKIPGGRPGDTSYVSGLVFSKNLALKSMPRTIPRPNILILTFPIEYSRHKQHFMSLDLLIRQEKEYLQNFVHRIAALKPHLLLCQKNISGLALGFLEKAGIATAYNLKASVLEAVSRCTQTRIISSIDKLAIKPAQAGRCASFYLKTYVHGGRKKTYMYLSGCPKELGCTIVLRGAEPADLRSIKRITEFMVYVVYNLKLETSFMRDEYALIPGYTGLGTIAPDKETKTSTEYVETKRSIAADVMKTSNAPASGATHEKSEAESPRTGTDRNGNTVPIPKLKTVGTTDSDEIPDDIPMPTFYGDMVEQYKDKALSISPFVRFMQPYLLIKAREQERRLVYLKRLLDQGSDDTGNDSEPVPEKFSLITPDMIHETYEGTSRQVREVLRAAQYAEYDKAVHNYRTQKKQWESYVTSNDNMFNPFNHQSITVLYSVVCMATSVPCSGPDLLALSYYNEHDSGETFEADCTLGQYVEDICFGANSVCFSNGCERRMYEHHRQYVHGAAQLSITVESHPAKLRGYQDIILMWSACRVCGNETQVMPMSENTWKYSFGKYLELTFWSHDLHARAGLCSHDLHRNYMRYFGYKNMAIRMQYDAINLLEIVVPRTRITWKVVNDLNFKNEVFKKAEDRVERFMISVKQRLEGINIDSVQADKAASCKEELDRLKKKAHDDHTFLLTKLQDKYTGSRYFEVVPLNRAVRATQEKVAEWDRAFVDFDRDFFPSDRDIRRLTALQFKKLFLDRDESVTSLTSNEDGESPPMDEKATEEQVPREMPTLTPKTRIMSPEQTRDMLHSVVEDHHAGSNTASTDRPTEDGEDAITPRAEADIQDTLEMPQVTGSLVEGATVSPTEAKDVHHLDLAVSVSHSSPPKALLHPDSRSTSPILPRSVSVMPSEPQEDSGSSGEPDATTPTGSPTLTRVTTASGIPRPFEVRTRRSGAVRSPPLVRTQSQPAHLRRAHSSNTAADLHTTRLALGGSTSPRTHKNTGKTHAGDKPEKKLSDRIGLTALKSGTSMIPRSIANRGKSTKVSTLAKHFEQLSREFEKERLRDRKDRAVRTREARAFPMKHAKPVIEIYRNVHEAVAERETSDDSVPSSPKHSDDEHTMAEIMAHNTVDQTAGEGFHAEHSMAQTDTAETTEVEDSQAPDSRAESDAELEGLKSDDEPSLIDLADISEAQHILSPSEAQLDLKLDLPKHEKNSLMKLMTTFWAERSASGWQSLEYPLRTTDHIFADSDIIIREDEPSSLIAFALDSRDYKEKIESIKARKEGSLMSHDKEYAEDLYLTTDEQKLIERSLRRETGIHLKYQFSEGSAKMLCKVFYAEQFDAVRRKCGVEDRIIDCLSRCLKWDSKGGKTKSVFLKTLDDRIVLKSLSQVETQAFLKFAPSYFELMGEALFHDLPSVIAKMLGFYQVIIKNPVTGTDFNWYVLVMENLFYDRNPTRIFDLKGSMRNRRINVTGEQNEVLLDENMVEFIYESPLFVREHSKRLMRASVYNDTLFLARQNVMDYSLMVAIDNNRQELVVGIIDCIRTYTWDKKLESWMKDRGKNRPTVTSPKEYKNRFREAMNRYVLLAPKYV
jgi:1-phosphatidylinositol-3-phosphate 5-kinase